uniref:IPT/TIG domain-containing protein n=1 Tax=Strongyloides stercoralis TaxID=6248 RepID=A0A0K0E0U9_STRER
MVKVTVEEFTTKDRVKRDTKLLGTWIMPKIEGTSDSTTNENGLELELPTTLMTENTDMATKSTVQNIINPSTTTVEPLRTIHFLKPSDILSAAGSRTVFNIPPANPNSTHEITIIADDGNATVIKGHNSISIKASSHFEN